MNKYELLIARSRSHNGKNKIIDNDLVEFYGSSDYYGKWFSNCVKSVIKIDGESYDSSEHYFLCMKFVYPGLDNKNIIEIMKLKTPVEVAKFGRTYRGIPIRNDWDEVRVDIMRKALEAKFNQNPKFMEKLLETKDAVLVERAPNDKYWAIDKNGVGLNMLGVLLMELRNKELKNKLYNEI